MGGRGAIALKSGTAGEPDNAARSAIPVGRGSQTFREQFVALFEAEFSRLHRVLNRLSGESQLAADLAQDTFVQLYRRGTLPDRPTAWLVTVALNRFRNARSTRARRGRLMSIVRGAAAHSDPSPMPDETTDARATRSTVRAAIDRMPERERNLLLLHAEGYSYREIASVLDLHEASVGTLLARARQAFRIVYQEAFDAHG